MSKLPINVQTYVKQIQALEYLDRTYSHVKNKVIHSLSNLLKVEVNSRLFTVCQGFEIESKEDKNRRFLDEIQTVITRLNQAIVKAHDSADKRKDLMKAKIGQKIPKLKEATSAFLEKVVDEKFLSVDSPLLETLQEIEHLEARSALLTQKARDITEFQQTLELDVSTFDYVDSARSEMLYRLKLWRALHEWGDVLVEKWKTAPFEQVDVSEITVNAENYTKIALQCERNLPEGSTAVARLKQLVFDFRETMPIVEALGNRHLRVEHWQEIKALLRTDYPLEERSFSLGELIAFNVAAY